MNELIKELVIEATKQVNDDLLKEDEAKCIWLTKWYSDLPMDQEKFQEKFAKMIINECAGIAYEYDIPNLTGPGEFIGNRMKKHFGVE